MARGTTVLAASRADLQGRLRPLLAAVAVLLGPALIGAGLVTPSAQGQSPSAEVTDLDVSPAVLHREGGIVDVHLTVETSLDDVQVVLAVRDPSGRVVQRSNLTALVPLQQGTLGLEHDLHIDPTGRTGGWSVEVERALTMQNETERSVSLSGHTRAGFQVYALSPVGGAPPTPWMQSGGDPAHTGRTLALGPQNVEVVRWTITARDQQAFHSPMIGPDGTIYAATWGGLVYAIDEEGHTVWSGPMDVERQIPYAPAIGTDGSVLVSDDAGTLTAIGPEREVRWRYQVPDGERLLSGPVVGPDGRVFVMRSPWTLVALEPDGDAVSSTALAPPIGGAPDPPRIPEPVPGPSIAVTSTGQALVVSGDGLAEVAKNGSLTQTISCNCTPRAVGLAPSVDIALVSADREVVATSLRTGQPIWSTRGSPAQISGELWHPPTVGWDDRVFITTEEGRLFNVSLDSADQVHSRNFFQPIRGQLVVDADHNLYFADACNKIRSVAPDLSTRWIKELDTSGCNGLAQSLALTRAGNVVWAGPDGKLRMLGSNRPPVPSFTTYWDEDGFVLDASNSTDPDDPTGASLSYAWQIGNETTEQGFRARPDLPGPGTYRIRLTVTDGISTVSTSRQVTVNFPPEPRISNRSQGLSIHLDASATTDPDGDNLTYRWFVGGEAVDTGPELRFNATGPTVHQVVLEVSDGNHTSRLERTVLAPDERSWNTARLALYRGDCPSGICTLPAELDLVDGRLVQIPVINGAGRTVQVTTGFPIVDGGQRQITVAPGDARTLYVKVATGVDSPIRVGLASGDRAPTIVPANVRPAPAEITWSLEDPGEDLSVGKTSSFDVRLTGSQPPEDVALDVRMTSGEMTLASRSTLLEAGEPVNRTVTLTWSPTSPGPADVRFTVDPTNRALATVQPAPEESGERTFTVAEASIWTTAIQAVQDNAAILSLSVLLAATSTAGILLWRRRETEETTMTPVSGSTPPVTDGDETVASGFMPRKVERFTIERVLGEGGFGKTYLARDTVLERDIVLKELEHVGQGQARDLLLHEAKTAANLSHGNVVVVHDVVEEEGRLLLVMEHVRGGTLSDLLGEPVPLKEALPIIRDILEGLSALHEAGIVHRDVKPSNILITPDGVAKITDFGVAARIEDGHPPEGDGDTFVGTPRYMAPEQLAGEAPGPQADVYAAGALFYQMLTGEHSLGLGDKTPSASELLEKRPNLPTPALSQELNRILEAALARDPSDRFDTAEAFLRALEQFGNSTTRRSGEASTTST